ncbi:MAG: signal peptidase II [Deltaproteobacteria bacterium]|nr:signal peptidase II [Deltaproteobacteria bacterium]
MPHTTVKKKLIFVGIIALIILSLDHLTKWFIVHNVALGGHITVIPHFFDIIHGRNTGAAFGFLSDWHSPLKNWFFYAVGLVALVFLYYYIKVVAAKDALSLIALAFILGGALGNVLDRIIRGSVVDFLSLHYYDHVWNPSLFGFNFAIPLTWPAFNVADAAITTAVVLLVIQSFRATGTTAKNADTKG